MTRKNIVTGAIKAMAVSLGLLSSSLAVAADMPGVSDTEIRIGNTAPYSGPASSYSVIAKAHAAYFEMINRAGGINGRKIKFISYDDAYSPPKTVEQTRRLVEGDDVLLVTQIVGTPPNAAVQRYMNQRKVPHLFAASGAKKFSDPANFHWTMGWNPTLYNEGKIYAKYLLENHPDATIGVLYQNDDYGKEVLQGLRDGLGEAAERMVVAEESYETSDPTVDSQIVKIRSTGATVFFNVATSKAAAQAIRKVHELNWKPIHILNSVSNSVGAVLEPAGLEASKDILSAGYLKDPTDPTWANDPDKLQWEAFMNEYYPNGDKTHIMTVFGYAAAQLLVEVLQQCGDDLSRENVMKQAANLNGVSPKMLLPGMVVNTSADDYVVLQNMQMMRFDGKSWKLFGDLL